MLMRTIDLVNALAATPRLLENANLTVTFINTLSQDSCQKHVVMREGKLYAQFRYQTLFPDQTPLGLMHSQSTTAYCHGLLFEEIGDGHLIPHDWQILNWSLDPV
jgi:hypothetical protein